MKRVLVTGAGGTIGKAVWEHLGGRFDVVGLDQQPGERVQHVADIAELEAIAPAFEGMDAVVHLAATVSVESPWAAVLHSNLIGTYNVYEAARRASVPTVVFASSNHAVGMYEV